MTLLTQIKEDLKTAMREGDVEKRGTLRLLLAATKQVEVDEQRTLDDEDVQKVVTKQAKQRRESIKDAENAGRPDLIPAEEAELLIIESYLPTMMSPEEVETVVAGILSTMDVSGPKDMGRVMGAIMPALKGKADGGVVSQIVQAALS